MPLQHWLKKKWIWAIIYFYWHGLWTVCCVMIKSTAGAGMIIWDCLNGQDMPPTALIWNWLVPSKEQEKNSGKQENEELCRICWGGLAGDGEPAGARWQGWALQEFLINFMKIHSFEWYRFAPSAWEQLYSAWGVVLLTTAYELSIFFHTYEIFLPVVWDAAWASALGWMPH